MLSKVSPSFVGRFGSCRGLSSLQRMNKKSLLVATLPLAISSSPSNNFVHFTKTRSYSSSSSLSAMNSVSGEDILKDFPAASDGSPLQGVNIALAMEALAQADCVCFDVDSTVVNEEGIDVLADYLGKGEQVAALTKAAMEGGMKFQDALAARLKLMKPSKQSIQACLQETPLELTDGVEDLVQALQAAGKDVFLVSGGFRIMIEPVAEILNIPIENIVANTVLFDAEGEYHDFDANEPTSQDMGKPKALQMIQQAKGYQTMVMVGDGATDAQAKPPAAAFIGFGGVAVRDKVKAVADWFVTDFAGMTQIVRAYGSAGNEAVAASSAK